MNHDHLIDLPLTQETLASIADPPHAHRLMATYLPDLAGRSQAIRADTGTQFRIDLANDPLGIPDRIRLRLRGPAIPEDLGTLAPTPPIDEGLRVVVVVAAEKRRTDERGIRVRPVTDPEAPTWARQLLARHGFNATDVVCSSGRSYGRTSKIRFTVRDLIATLTPTDIEQAQRAMHHGIGRGRAYGLGMLVPVPSAAS